jgi:hypothetical protein
MRRQLALSLSLTTLLLCSGVLKAQADEVRSESGSSSSSTELVGEKKGYALKYAERVKNWGEQIDTGVSKGWLTADDASKFRSRLENLRQLNNSVSSKGYPKADLNDMEKQFNQFNIDLSHASATPKTAATPGADSSKATTTDTTSVKKTTKSTPAHVNGQ